MRVVCMFFLLLAATALSLGVDFPLIVIAGLACYIWILRQSKLHQARIYALFGLLLIGISDFYFISMWKAFGHIEHIHIASEGRYWASQRNLQETLAIGFALIGILIMTTTCAATLRKKNKKSNIPEVSFEESEVWPPSPIRPEDGLPKSNK